MIGEESMSYGFWPCNTWLLCSAEQIQKVRRELYSTAEAFPLNGRSIKLLYFFVKQF